MAHPSRRTVLALAAGAVIAGTARAQAATAVGTALSVTQFAVKPDLATDQSVAIQKAIDSAATSRLPLFFPAGAYRAGNLALRSGSRLSGVPGLSRLVHASGGVLLAGSGIGNAGVEGLVFDGAGRALASGQGTLAFTDGQAIRIRDCTVTGSAGHGIALTRVGGEVSGCTLVGAAQTALFALDSRGLAIRSNSVEGAGNNGIQVWRSAAGEDGTLVLGNRITGVQARDGGSGQNGNGINIYRAGNVIVADNRISVCAFSAVRGNAASNLQVRGNSCTGLGEVAIFIEFGFQGAVIAGNLVDDAAVGICVTNFNEGGRLATVEGNLIRNLAVRYPPGTDPGGSAGIGIIVEADASVSGNVVEGAPDVGIRLGYGPYLRDITVTGNVVRNSSIGIGVSLVVGAGTAIIAANTISGAQRGAVMGLNQSGPTTGDLLAAGAAVDPRLTLSANRTR
ncbi:MAG TPA: TIGR03808 family TAT-translocated repetitive protein [Xanthobacteraceae bacterium]|nr:TIGR03808 family TAT-translocated repetitive protein [Xanthobacteraceae bacterium]